MIFSEVPLEEIKDTVIGAQSMLWRKKSVLNDFLHLISCEVFTWKINH